MGLATSGRGAQFQEYYKQWAEPRRVLWEGQDDSRVMWPKGSISRGPTPTFQPHRAGMTQEPWSQNQF